nr:MAG TPA: hypothetical protein [Caudoviricetes sp.]
MWADIFTFFTKEAISVGLLRLLFGPSGKEKELLCLQRLVMKDSPNKLIMSEKQLKSTARRQASNYLRIAKDCTAIVSDTIRPDVFFPRLELLKETSKHLADLEPYISFSGASPSAAYREVLRKENECIALFIERYLHSACAKARTMKTEKGKMNQYIKAYDGLKSYFHLLPLNAMNEVQQFKHNYIAMQ